MGIENIRESIWVPSQQEMLVEQAWLEEQLEVIGSEKMALAIEEAVKVRERAYMPYSGYQVGAVIICLSGKIHASCNAEAVSYTESDHAERSAITKAISEGEIENSGRKFIQAVVVSHPGESGPCGGCRQRIVEHCDNAVLVDVDGSGNVQRVTSLKALYQYGFTPTHLGIE